MGLSRRNFLGGVAATTLAASPAAAAKTGMPTRRLGQTGRKVSILVFGSGSRFLMYDDDQAEVALNKALDLGVTYVDTAFGYGNGKSETRVGRVMKTRRNQVFLATKCNVRGGDEAMRQIEGSLKRLQTDHLDLLHIHSLAGEDDLAKIEAKGGVLETLHKLRDQKVTANIGITCHTDPFVLKTALERHDFNVTQMALNAARMGMAATDRTKAHPEDSFESLALPVANRKKMGVIAMKIFAQEKLNGKASVDQLIRYTLSLPVTAVVIGMPKLEHIDENIQVAKNFKAMPKAEMKTLSDKLAAENKVAIDLFFRNHIDC
jgi:uncharacterized protein